MAPAQGLRAVAQTPLLGARPGLYPQYVGLRRGPVGHHYATRTQALRCVPLRAGRGSRLQVRGKRLASRVGLEFACLRSGACVGTLLQKHRPGRAQAGCTYILGERSCSKRPSHTFCCRRHHCRRCLHPPPTFVPPHPPQIVSKHSAVPEAQGLFNPENDKDACGVGFVAGEQQPGPSQQVRAGRHWRPAAGAGACLPPAPRPCWQSLPNHRHVVVSACMPALPITVMCYPCSAVAPFGRLPATPPTCPPNLLIAPSSPPPTAELSKEPKRQTVVEALEMLRRMTHRGACGCETNTGGAAGPEFMDGTPAVGNPCIVAGWSPSRVPTLK